MLVTTWPKCTSVVTYDYVLSSALDAGVVGLALAYTISLAGILQYCVRQSAEVENIVSIALLI